MAIAAENTAPTVRRNSTLFRRVSAQAMGMEHDSLCHKSHWVPKSSRAACANCSRAFRVFHAKHHCRLCGDVVCGACSTKRILFQKKSVRSCDACVNQSVESISRLNRRSSSSTDSSSDEANEPRRLAKRASESDVLIATPSAVELRRRGESLPVMKTTAMTPPHHAAYRPLPHSVAPWRLQLPYLLVFFLMTIAGITNVLALTA